jgi:hypothetical protein
MTHDIREYSGAAGGLSDSEWLSSADFPDYDKDVVLTIKNVKIGRNLQFGEGRTERQKGIAIFSETSKMLVLNAGHRKALSKLFGKRVEHWRGRVAVFCQKDAAKVAGVKVDGVRIRPYVPKSGAGVALNDKPNEGGSPGKLGSPQGEPT